jgi:hypothetical protein
MVQPVAAAVKGGGTDGGRGGIGGDIRAGDNTSASVRSGGDCRNEKSGRAIAGGQGGMTGEFGVPVLAGSKPGASAGIGTIT